MYWRLVVVERECVWFVGAQARWEKELISFGYCLERDDIGSPTSMPCDKVNIVGI